MSFFLVNYNNVTVLSLCHADSTNYRVVSSILLYFRLEDYIEKHERGLITTIKNDRDNTINGRMTTTRKQKWEGKQLYGRFKRLINNITHQKTWTWLRKGNLKKETESLRVAAQNNVITNHIEARIDKTQQNNKWRLCSDRDEISQCSKLAQKEYKARHD